MTTDASRLTTSPELAELRSKLERLKGELARALTARQDLLETVIPNLRARWLSELGPLELALLKLEVETRGLKRAIELIQARLNRGEEPVPAEIRAQISRELAEWTEKVGARAREIESACMRLAGLMPAVDALELRRVFLALARRLHPDVNPEPTRAETNLWHRALDAYGAGDLEGLRGLQMLVQDLTLPVAVPSALDELQARCEQLLDRIRKELARTEELRRAQGWESLIKVEDPSWVSARRVELDTKIVQAKAWNAALAEEADRLAKGLSDGLFGPS